MQSVRTRLTQISSHKRQELASGLPTPWSEAKAKGYPVGGHAISRASLLDVERGETGLKSQHERQPLLAASSGSENKLVALQLFEASRTDAAMLRQPIDHKGPAEWAAIRRRAAENRDARFERSTAALLLLASQEKPGGYPETTYWYHDREGSDNPKKLGSVSGRLATLEKIHVSIQPDQCRFNKTQADAYAREIIKEYNFFFQTMSFCDEFCPKKIELFTEHVANLIDAIRCDQKTEEEIKHTFKAAVMHQVWQVAKAAQAEGRTNDLERLIALHAKWQTSGGASQAPSAEDTSIF